MPPIKVIADIGEAIYCATNIVDRLKEVKRGQDGSPELQARAEEDRELAMLLRRRLRALHVQAIGELDPPHP